MYGVKGTAVTAVPAVAGAATLPSTGQNSVLNFVVFGVIAIGAIATITQIGLLIYRRHMLR